MDRRAFRRGPVGLMISGMGAIIFTLIIMVMILFGLRQTEAANRAEGVRLLEEGILRAVIHSYAVSGHYPESLEYIVENFGIHIDETRFLVHYNIFATNILPEIIVWDLRMDVEDD